MKYVIAALLLAIAVVGTYKYTKKKLLVTCVDRVIARQDELIKMNGIQLYITQISQEMNLPYPYVARNEPVIEAYMSVQIISCMILD